MLSRKPFLLLFKRKGCNGKPKSKQKTREVEHLYKICSIGKQLQGRMNRIECASLIVKVPTESDTQRENVYVKGTCLDQVSRFEIGQWARRLSRRFVRIILACWELDVFLECNSTPLDTTNTLDTLETRRGMRPKGRSSTADVCGRFLTYNLELFFLTET